MGPGGLMVRVNYLILLCASLAVAGCGKPQWSKAGLSQVDVKAQEDVCWNYVLNTPEGQTKVANARTLRAITGGPITLLLINNKNPKEDTSNIMVHNGCMKDHGFTP